MNKRYTPERITELKANDVFVFVFYGADKGMELPVKTGKFVKILQIQ